MSSKHFSLPTQWSCQHRVRLGCSCNPPIENGRSSSTTVINACRPGVSDPGRRARRTTRLRPRARVHDHGPCRRGPDAGVAEGSRRRDGSAETCPSAPRGAGRLHGSLAPARPDASARPSCVVRHSRLGWAKWERVSARTARLLAREDLAEVVNWLATHRPMREPDVICHGDLHPFNVLVTLGGSITVLDSSAALLAPATYDVAFTGLILTEPPVAVPRPLRPLARIAGRFLGRRFHAEYQNSQGICWTIAL